MFHVVIKDKSKILLSNWHKKGTILFQDKASSLIVELLSPKSGDFICDMCAAPGIKSSLIAQLANNKSKIISNDFSLKRLEPSRTFFELLKVSNYSLLNSDAITFPIKLDTKFDKILIDAPCTGSGTFLFNPELKWRQNGKFLNQNLIIQEKLIKSGLNYLKEKGILVYSTCSLYPEEGEFQVMKFKEFLEPLELPNWISPSYKIKNCEIQGTGRLFPAIHHTQGFFVSKFKKKET
jgi:16S rRNA C967 or C1407 C5-methylase (RsmB/RsmF family)